MAWQWRQEGDRFRLEGAEGLIAFTATRSLGMSAGEFTAAELKEAAAKAGVTAPAVAGMQQVHGSHLERVEKSENQVLASCDALITSRAGIALVVRSADCLPVIALDPVRRVLGVAHAGWRGVKAGVLSRLVQEMGSSELQIAIGPGIGACCYEVGPEFEAWAGPFLRREGSRRFFDLKGAAVRQLCDAGVKQVLCAPWCTACTSECHSYRREKEDARRMVTFAQLQP